MCARSLIFTAYSSARMMISFILAVDEKNAMGYKNQLLCHLPNDLKFFKATTLGHHIVMGRKTYDSIGRPLPNRVNVVITRDKDLKIEGCVVVHSLQEAIDLAKNAGEEELMITGGAEIFKQAFPIADRIYLTLIKHVFEADTFFPEMDPQEWKLVSEIPQAADEKNKYEHVFMIYDRNY